MRPGLMLFAVLAVAMLLALLAVPGPRSIDRHTGERIGTVEDRLRELRQQGDAQAAAAALPKLRRLWPESSRIIALQVALAAELSPPRPGEPDRMTAEVEEFFAPAAARVGGVDARAADLLERLRRKKRTQVAAFQAMADEFASRGRPRAQLRWLHRGLRRFPGDLALALSLARVHVASGRLEEALDATAGGRADDGVLAAARAAGRAHAGDAEAKLVGEFWAQRAQLGAWLDRPEVEAEALARGMSEEGDPGKERRLIDLYQRLGTPARGVPYAIRIAARSRSQEDQEFALRLAFRAGETDAAFGVLSGLVANDLDAWLPRAATLAERAGRLELARQYLEARFEETPDEESEEALLDFLRRHGPVARHLELLQDRFAKNPSDHVLGLELIEGLLGAGRRDEAREVQRTVVSQLAPVEFFQSLPSRHRRGERGLGWLANAMAGSAGLDLDQLPVVLSSVRALATLPRFRPAVNVLIDRFRSAAWVQEFHLDLLGAYPVTEQAEKLAALAARHPGAVVYLAGWVARSRWLEDPAMELRARAALLRTRPQDDANRESLARLLEAAGRPAEALVHWRLLADQVGATLPAIVRCGRAMLTAGNPEEAAAWLRRRLGTIRDPQAQLAAADLLFAADHADASLEFYLRHLDRVPDHRRSLLRIAKIKSWAQDTAGALPYFKRLIALGDADPRLRFHVAEALMAADRKAEARPHYAAALGGLDGLKEPSVADARERAICLFRLGRDSEAIAAYEDLIEQRPRDAGLHLDLMQLRLRQRQLVAAERHLSRAVELDRHGKRTLRSTAELAVRRRQFGRARVALESFLANYGADAGAYAQLGSMAEDSGEDFAALDAYRRWVTLQQTSVPAAAALQRVGDRVANFVGGRANLRRVGDDRLAEVFADGGLWVGDRYRVFGALGSARYEGRAAIAGNGVVTTDTALLDLGGSVRFFKRHVVGAGGRLHPGAKGDPAAVWANVRLQGAAPYWSLDFRVHHGELLINPLAAAGLHGRSDGFELRGFVSSRSGFWSGIRLDDRWLRIEDPTTGQRLRDEYFVGQASLGYSWLDSTTAVGSPFEPFRAPAGPVSPGLGPQLAGKTPWQVATWATVEAIRLRDDEELLDALPIGNHFNYLLLTSRIDRRLGVGRGASLEAYVGTDLAGSGSVWGARLSGTWRASPGLEATGLVGVGDELGRAGSGQRSVQLGFQLIWRW